MTTSKKGIDMLISFDTTGSMYPVLSRVRREVRSFINDMSSSVPNLRIAIIAHGDYCDKDDPYTIRVMPFTTNIDELCEFVEKTEKTYGGDADECYELVLSTARSTLDWKDDRDKVMIIIGDASPHGINYPYNTAKLDWVDETRKLANMGVKIFPVHALSYYRSSSRNFYETMARMTGGTYLTLDQFDEIMDLIKATCLAEFSEEKLTDYISIIRSNGRMTRTLARNLGRLQGEDKKYMGDFCSVASEGLVPVNPGRFQVMHVDHTCDIRGFVTSNGITFKRGRGFYELTKHETVQQYKEVIIQDRETGEMFTGTQVRERLGLLPQCDKGGAKESLSSRNTRDYRVFVQSTSVNRKLIAGTAFLYEIDDFADTGTVVKAPSVTAKVEDTTSKDIAGKTSDKSDKTKMGETKAETTKKVTKKKSSKKTETKVDTVTGIGVVDTVAEAIAKVGTGKKTGKITATQKANVNKAMNTMIMAFGDTVGMIERVVNSTDKTESTIEDVIMACNNLKNAVDSIITNIK